MAIAVREWISENGFETLDIKPGGPAQNVYSESFNRQLRDELLNVVSFGLLLEAKMLGKAWLDAYNEKRMHSALDYKTPVVFARQSNQASFTQLEGIAMLQAYQLRNSADPLAKPGNLTTNPPSSQAWTPIATGSNFGGIPVVLHNERNDAYLSGNPDLGIVSFVVRAVYLIGRPLERACVGCFAK